jgi:RHH-type proline utilization regulon transcriptional repressor/proline dehydrogenase/delta 1-pyrroline-5-carboxylate dehydrogenase
LKGAMQELRVGRPDRLAIDIGPVIDAEAQKNLQNHIDAMRTRAKSFYALELPLDCENGTFIAPTVIEINSLSELTKEVFGPVLHVLRYKRDELPGLIAAINETGFGLTLGVHSRIDETINFISQSAHVGNIYVNRNIVGAVVGVQPFGGEGKSGTGPKAGGPLYLKRLQKNAAMSFSGNTVYEKQSPVALDALTVWAKTHGHVVVASLAENYARLNPYKMTMMLPGPTGETNTLAFAARGRVFCAASDVATLLNQIAASLATGNTPVLEAKTKQLLPADLPKSIFDAIIEATPDQSQAQFALLGRDLMASYQTVFAQQNGAIVCVIESDAQNALPLWRLVAERALCINTTAAGGNASLMTLQN